MLPVGHVAYTWGTVNLIQRRVPAWSRLDYRLLAIFSLLPDVIDKPLALTLLKDTHTSHGPAHMLLLHVLLAAVALYFWRARAVPYLLAFNGHLLCDEMWYHSQTLLFPFLGWSLDPWRFMGSPEAMANAYWDVLHMPKIWAIEGLAMAIMVYFVRRYRLHRWSVFREFLTNGRLGPIETRIPPGGTAEHDFREKARDVICGS